MFIYVYIYIYITETPNISAIQNCRFKVFLINAPVARLLQIGCVYFFCFLQPYTPYTETICRYLRVEAVRAISNGKKETARW